MEAKQGEIRDSLEEVGHIKDKKDDGGLGFKDLFMFNKVMLGKQAWRLAQSPTSLWSKIFGGIYFPNGDLWSA